MAVDPSITLEDMVRFESFVVPDPNPRGCRIWTGWKDRWGYGQFKHNSKPVKAHRAAFGPIPDGLVVMHTCDQPSCVRESHLLLGTVADNNADAKSKGRSLVKLDESKVIAIRA